MSVEWIKLLGLPSFKSKGYIKINCLIKKFKIFSSPHLPHLPFNTYFCLLSLLVHHPPLLSASPRTLSHKNDHCLQRPRPNFHCRHPSTPSILQFCCVPSIPGPPLVITTTATTFPVSPKYILECYEMHAEIIWNENFLN